ncbi:MAG: hypothetical protein JOZ69_08260 [Myxococcales bacterium]|nr:hypothetical protein [Myxococcales bacterium]
MLEPDVRPPAHPLREVGFFFALACTITWALDAPLALAWFTGTPPPPYAMPLVGLGAHLV